MKIEMWCLRDRLKNVAIGMVRSKTTAKDYNEEKDLATITTQHHALTQAGCLAAEVIVARAA